MRIEIKLTISLLAALAGCSSKSTPPAPMPPIWSAVSLGLELPPNPKQLRLTPFTWEGPLVFYPPNQKSYPRVFVYTARIKVLGGRNQSVIERSGMQIQTAATAERWWWSNGVNCFPLNVWFQNPSQKMTDLPLGSFMDQTVPGGTCKIPPRPLVKTLSTGKDGRASFTFGIDRTADAGFPLDPGNTSVATDIIFRARADDNTWMMIGFSWRADLQGIYYSYFEPIDVGIVQNLWWDIDHPPPPPPSSPDPVPAFDAAPACDCLTANSDTDGDGVPDCLDGCPLDPNKITPGACGCGRPDIDSDGDGTPDCLDGCPFDPSRTTPPCHQSGDLDGDGDVDLDDFGLFQICLGLVSPLDPNCAAADLNRDGVVDSQDAALFRKCLSGAGIPAVPSCAY